MISEECVCFCEIWLGITKWEKHKVNSLSVKNCAILWRFLNVKTLWFSGEISAVLCLPVSLDWKACGTTGPIQVQLWS